MGSDRASTSATPTTPDVPPHARAARVLARLLGVAATAIVLAGVRSAFYDLDRHAVPKELVLHAFSLVALLVLVRRWRRLELDVVTLPLAGFLLWSALSAALATSHWIALRAFAISFAAVVILVTSRFIVRHGEARTALGGLAAAATAGVLIGSAQAWGLDVQWLASDRPPGGTFGNRNFLAHFTAIALPVLLLLVLRVRSRAMLFASTAATVLSMNALVLTRSRAGWLGVAAALVTFVLAVALSPVLRARLPARRLLLLPAALAAGVAIALLVPNRLEWRSSSPYSETLTRITDYRQGSGRGRLIQYRNTLGIARMDPVFGAGPGNWFVKYPLVTTRNDPSFHVGDPIPTNPWPSSDWLALLAERGAIGVLFVLLTGIAIVLSAFNRLRASDEDAAMASAALLAVIAAVTITGMFDAVLLNPAPAFLVAAATGLLLPRTRHIIDSPLHGPRRRSLIVVTVSFALIATTYAAVQLAAIRVTAASRTRATIERAVRIDPTSHRLHLDLARRGNCRTRIPHARIAASLLPYHATPGEALAACGQRN